jgi:hypothetical protein
LSPETGWAQEGQFACFNWRTPQILVVEVGVKVKNPEAPAVKREAEEDWTGKGRRFPAQ